MSTTNPKHKPLHRLRMIRNAERAAERFPQLALALFTPIDAINRRCGGMLDPLWLSDCGGLRSVAPRFLPPQPTMTQFYQMRTGDLHPVPFDSLDAQIAYHAQNPQPGFVSVVRSGPNQYKRMLKAGLDAREPPTREELQRRAEHEAKVQQFRDEITVQTIMDESHAAIEGKNKKGAEPFPMWKEMVKRGREKLADLNAMDCQPEGEDEDCQDEDEENIVRI
ncbi:unnamed protein product [Discula destructiva]